jgi:hypothetical protein
MIQNNLFDETDPTKHVKEMSVLASFSIERRAFIEALKAVKRPIHLSRKDMYQLKFELFVMENKVLIRLYENEYWLDLKTKGTCRTSLFYKDVMDTLTISKEFWIDVTVKQKTIGLNQVNLTSPTESFDPDKREIPLSAISAPTHSHDSFAVTPEKDFFTKDLQKGFCRETVEKDVRYVRAALKKYSIPKKDIELFIYSYLNYSRL